MFDKDFWQEVLQTIRRQKARSVMTAFGVFWGLLMLMFLIGAGMGFQEGAVGQLKNIPSNSVGYITDITSMRYKGFERGRQWNIDDRDIDAITTAWPGMLRHTIYVKFLPSVGNALTIMAGENSNDATVVAVSPMYYNLSPQRILHGRYINEFDCRERRKVCVIGDNLAKTLFSSVSSAVGKDVKIDDISYRVIGVTRKTNAMVNFSTNESDGVFVPITTGQYMYNVIGKTDFLFLVLNDGFQSADYVKSIASLIRSRHNIHPDDDTAIAALDLKQQLGMFDIMLAGINALIWLIGLGTLLAGIIGISNIMMVTVKERTQEIGIRRALGAQPWTIIKQIMCESLMLTLAAGILGIIAGVWGMHFINRMTAGMDSGFFTNPYVPFVPAVAALMILVVGGLFAGFVPAHRAMKIKAIEALREE